MGSQGIVGDRRGHPKTEFVAYVVVTLADFLAQAEGGTLIPRLTLTDPQTGEIQSTFDLEIRQQDRS